jgi:polysaccharide biosynthesis protein PslH
MDILYVTHFNPWNPKYGAAFRSFGILRGLNQKYTLHVVLISQDRQEIEGFLRGWPGFDHLHVLHPGGSGGSLRRQYQALLKQTTPGLVWYFTKYALRRVGTPGKIPFVLDLDDVPWRKLVLMGRHQRGWQKARAYAKVLPSLLEDSWLARRADGLVITNAAELGLLATRRPAEAVANGFDFPSQQVFQPRPSCKVLFFGSLFYYPNLDGLRWLCQEIWPRVQQAVPDAELDVVGLYKADEIHLAETPGVRLHGFVDDLDCYIAESACLVVPLRIASGTRIKILEAWSKGLPVVSTTLGAEGLGAVPGENILAGDTPEAFAAATVRLLQQPELGARLASQAYTHGKACFSWEAIYPSLEKIISTATAR